MSALFESDKATLDRLTETFSPLAATINSQPGTTIVPEETAVTGDGEDVVTQWRQNAKSTGPLASRLQIESRIGKGGMGEVMLASQRSVGRKVAVKRLPAGAATERAVTGLLREGWVTGTLEHPNVMPLYDLGLDDEGRPLMVLKRIEGVVWRDLMTDAETVQQRFGMDLLQWNLQILVHLCNALGYAHSKQILHRDLKPDNVMVGEFGEVYLLDWGIAVSLDEEGESRLPRASRVRDLAGTPAYMAPEMLDPHPGRLGIHTDIYLLGAVLYEIITGSSPHSFRNFEQFIKSVMASSPDFPGDAPDELVAICRRAMARDPGERYGSTDELRLAVQSFLAHRGSAELEVHARHRLGELLELLESTQEHDEDSRLEIYERFSECRFGFREAIKAWNGNGAAREGLREATRAMVDYELELGNPRAAAGLLAVLDREDAADLRQRVEAALAKLREDEKEVERLRDFRKGHARTTGRAARRVIMLSVGILCTVTPLGALVFPDLAERYATLVAIPAAYLVGALIVRYSAAATIKRSVISRSLLLTLTVMLATETMLSLAGAIAGIDVATLQTLHFVPWLTTALTINVRFRPKALYVPATYAAGLLVSMYRPELRIAAMVVSHGTMALSALFWALETLDKPESPQPIEDGSPPDDP